MKRSNGFAIVAVLLLTSGVPAAHRVLHTREACRYFRAYEKVKRADAPMNFVERLLCAFVLAKVDTCT